MTLMKFSPETVRLRRVARAYAAGEFSRSEYRAERREVIANFRPDSTSDDDTQRRDSVAEGAEEVSSPRPARRFNSPATTSSHPSSGANSPRPCGWKSYAIVPYFGS